MGKTIKVFVENAKDGMVGPRCFEVREVQKDQPSKFQLMQLPYTVYILKCANGKHYTGNSANITKRLIAHRNGEVHFTKDKLPVELVHQSLFSIKQKAYDFEDL